MTENATGLVLSFFSSFLLLVSTEKPAITHSHSHNRKRAANKHARTSRITFLRINVIYDKIPVKTRMRPHILMKLHVCWVRRKPLCDTDPEIESLWCVGGVCVCVLV